MRWIITGLGNAYELCHKSRLFLAKIGQKLVSSFTVPRSVFSFKGGGGGDTLLALLLFSRIHVMSVPQPRACMLKEKDY